MRNGKKPIKKLNTKQIMKSIKSKRGTLKCWMENKGLLDHQQVVIKVIRNEYPYMNSNTAKKVIKALKKEGLLDL